MKLIDLKCPACGADMKVNPDLKRLICIYCGKEMLVDDGVTELVIANGYDYGYEQEMGRLKAQEDFRLELEKQEEQIRKEEEERLRERAEREEEFQRAERLKKKAKWTPWFVGSVAVGALGLIMMAVCGFVEPVGFIGMFMVLAAFVTGYFVYGRIFGSIPTYDEGDVDYAMFPKGMEPFNLIDFGEAVTKLKEAGFLNITCRNLHDIKHGRRAQENKVHDIRVSGKIICTGGSWYPKYIPILITYHGR